MFRDFIGNRDKQVFTWETVTNDFYVSSSFCYVFFHMHVYDVQAPSVGKVNDSLRFCGPKQQFPSTHDVTYYVTSIALLIVDYTA